MEEQIRGREIEEQNGDEKGKGRNMRYEKWKRKIEPDEKKGKERKQEIGKEGINQGAMEEGENMEQKKIKEKTAK